MGSTGFCGEPMRKYEAHRKSEDALRRSIDVIYREKDTDAAVERVLSIAARFYNADRCYLYEYFEDETCYKNTYGWNRDGVSPIDKTMTYSEDTINSWLEDYGKEGEVWIASVEDEINRAAGLRRFRLQYFTGSKGRKYYFLSRQKRQKHHGLFRP